ncbi:MAG: hypothetical protein ACR2H3_10235 [Acidimicrobiales bacterium]
MPDENHDDFDVLGEAVARVLRQTFATTSAGRTDEAMLAERLAGAELEVSDLLEEARGVRRRALSQSESIVAEAKAEAEKVRQTAAADAEAIAAIARDEVARARGEVHAAREQLDREVRRMFASVRKRVTAFDTSVVREQHVVVDRAGEQAAAIIAQARIHHAEAAAEVDRMIEAAAREGARLRRAAAAEALRATEQVRGVIELDEAAPRRRQVS